MSRAFFWIRSFGGPANHRPFNRNRTGDAPKCPFRMSRIAHRNQSLESIEIKRRAYNGGRLHEHTGQALERFQECTCVFCDLKKSACSFRCSSHKLNVRKPKPTATYPLATNIGTNISIALYLHYNYILQEQSSERQQQK